MLSLRRAGGPSAEVLRNWMYDKEDNVPPGARVQSTVAGRETGRAPCGVGPVLGSVAKRCCDTGRRW